MPARKQAWNYKGSNKIRESIEAQKIINHLQDKLLNNGNFTSNEIGAAKLLLDRAVPSLSNIEITGDVGGATKLIWADSDDTDRIQS